MEVLEWRISSFKSWPKQTVFIDRIDIWVSDSCLRFHEICPQGRYTFFFGQTTIKFQSDSVTHMFEFKETKVAKKICQDDTFKSNAHIQATVQAVAKMNALIVSIKESLREKMNGIMRNGSTLRDCKLYRHDLDDASASTMLYNMLQLQCLFDRDLKVLCKKH